MVLKVSLLARFVEAGKSLPAHFLLYYVLYCTYKRELTVKFSANGSQLIRYLKQISSVNLRTT